MPIPERRPNETLQDYINRLTDFFIGEGDTPEEAYAKANRIARGG